MDEKLKSAILLLQEKLSREHEMSIKDIKSTKSIVVEGEVITINNK